MSYWTDDPNGIRLLQITDSEASTLHRIKYNIFTFWMIYRWVDENGFYRRISYSSKSRISLKRADRVSGSKIRDSRSITHGLHAAHQIANSFDYCLQSVMATAARSSSTENGPCTLSNLPHQHLRIQPQDPPQDRVVEWSKLI